MLRSRAQKGQQFGQEQALREQVAGNEAAHRASLIDVANRGLEQKGAALEPDENALANLITTYTNPATPPAQKIGVRQVLMTSERGKATLNAIDAEEARLRQDIAGGGAGAPTTGEGGGFWQGAGDLISQAGGYDKGMAPIQLLQQIPKLFQQDQTQNAPPGEGGEAARRKKRVMQSTYSEGRAPNY